MVFDNYVQLSKMGKGIFVKWIRKQKPIIKVLLFIPYMAMMLWDLWVFLIFWLITNNFWIALLAQVIFIPIGLMMKEEFFFDN